MSFDERRFSDNRLTREFYSRDALTVAKDLLGKYLVSEKEEGRTAGMIVETEAYKGEEDPASHAFGGKKTDRTEVQFKEGGRAYVYLIYGMYHCFNVVAGKEGEPESVFIRALEPVQGEEIMSERRGITEEKRKKELTNGPGKLCMAMGISKDMSGKDLCGDDLFICGIRSEEDIEVKSAERINIDYAGEAKTWPWRFLVKGNPYVSESA
ncbi:MAG: DNA-3-methyladenine glycosylase [Candidatus Thermoplasmatota archaeon]